MVLLEVVVGASLGVHRGSSMLAQVYNTVGLGMDKGRGRGMEHLKYKIFMCNQK